MSFGIYAIQFYIQSSLPLLRRFLRVSLCYIPILKGMYALISCMKFCQYGKILCLVLIPMQKLIHFISYFIRSYGLIHADHVGVLFIISDCISIRAVFKYSGFQFIMKLFYQSLGQRFIQSVQHPIEHQKVAVHLLHILCAVIVLRSGERTMVKQRSRLLLRKCASFYLVGVVGEQALCISIYSGTVKFLSLF